MTKELLQNILASPYKRERWIQLIRDINPEPKLNTNPPKLELDKGIAANGFEIGNFETADGMLIGLYEIALQPSIHIERSRVGLRNLLRKYYRQVDGCFAVYYSDNKWRFSYISETRTKDENSEWAESKTEPKRFTYMLGEGETVRTAVDRFDILFRSGKKLDDIKDAFSVEKVTDEFYKELRKIFNEIQDYIVGLDDEYKKDFAQLIINRLIFLKFLEKKGWLFTKKDESPESRKNYFNIKIKQFGKQNLWEQFFIHLFFKGLNRPSVSGERKLTDAMADLIGYVPFLNGGLFEESKDWNDKQVQVENIVFFNIFENLLNRFNFTVSENTPIDIEIALNPDLLGYAYEEMISEQHGQGAYYTHPTEVGLMCREALTVFLNEHTNIEYEKLIDLVFSWDSDKLNENEALKIYKLLQSVKILDPAVGSGAYPVRMMQELVQIHYALSQKLSAGTLRQIIKNKLTDPQSFFELKRNIIENNLYGADIDHFAVEIAKLRFWLSLVVEYNKEIKSPEDLKEIPALPNLDFKLRTGDSLLAMPGKVKTKEGYRYVNLDLHIADKEIMQIFTEEVTSQLRKLKQTYFNFEEERKSDAELLTISKDDLRKQIAETEIEIFRKLGFNLEKDPDSLKHIIWQIHYAEIFDGENFGFDICIANPPYLRQEKINEMFSAFNSGVSKDDLVAAYEKLYKKLNLKIDKKSDLYVYFFLRGINLLKEKGVLCYICSNSWLDVGYGKTLQEVLLKTSRIKMIYDNSARRSFAKADVNTTINVFIKDSSVDRETGHSVTGRKKSLSTESISRFVVFKDSFEKAATADNLKVINQKTDITSNDKWRVYPIPQNTLYKNSLDESIIYEGDKWGGKYLRAPDIFFTILEKGKDKLVRLGDIAEVRRGFTTGANEFFYLDEEKIKHWGIEEEFLKPVIKSPRECKSIKIILQTLSSKIIICHKTKNELKGTNLLKYINWGEKQTTDEGVNWNAVPSVKGRRHWYNIDENETDVLIIPRTFNDIYICHFGGVNYSDRFYGIVTKVKNLITFFNSTLFAFFSECLAKQGLGLGALDLNIRELVKIPIFIDFNENYLIKREIKSVFDELGFDKTKPIRSQKPNPLPDRKALDDIIFDALGLTKAEREEVYYAVCELVQNRLRKARSV